MKFNINAFAPGHVTLIFSIRDDHENPLEKGSIGAGFSINKGVTTNIEIQDSQKSEILININEKVAEANVTRMVVEAFSSFLKHKCITINHKIEFPISAGFGASGAGALSTAFALNDIVGKVFTDITCGQIAHTARLIRNHGEVAIETGLRTYKTEILGYNYRMIEFEAAMGRVGLKDLNEQNAGRRELAYYLNGKLKGVSGLRLPFTAETNIHTFYVYAFGIIEEEFGIPRELFARALNAEGIPVYCGYSKPLYLSPLYQERRHWAYRLFNPKINYEKGICPIAERAYEKTLLQMEAVRPPATMRDMNDIAEAIIKIVENKNELMID